MRIAYLTTEYPKVSHTFIRRELRALEARGHTVLRLSIRAGGAYVDEADEEEARKTFTCLATPAPRMLTATSIALLTRPVAFVRAVQTMLRLSRVSERGLLRHCAYLVEASILLRHLRLNRIQHVHVHFGTNSAAVALLIRRLGGPSYSMTIHGPDEFDAPIGGSLGIKVHESAFTVAISSFGMSQIRRWIQYEDWAKVHIVHCSVGPEFLEMREVIPPDSETLTCVGRLTAQKGQLVLLEALSLLRERGVSAQVTLVGDGEMREVVERRIQELGLEDDVTITGWVDEREIRGHLLKSRALVLPSFAEGLPVAIMEALALGRPVVTTRIAGIPELVTDNECGWLTTPSDVDALASALQTVLEVPTSELDAMGAIGRVRVAQEHFAETEAAKLEVLIAAAVGVTVGEREGSEPR